MKTEGNFINHCDDELCDLGYFEYTCPNCNKYIENYDVWWESYSIWSGTPFYFDCEKCSDSLVVEWDKNTLNYQVSKNK